MRRRRRRHFDAPTRQEAAWTEDASVPAAGTGALKMKRAPRSSRGAQERVAVASLVLSNERLRCLRSPELEADARPESQAVDRVLTEHALRHPGLDVDRAEVVANPEYQLEKRQ